MKSCALVGRVDFNIEHFKAQNFDCVVAVDSGYAQLIEIGCVPDQVIGDFDSLGYVPEHPHIEHHPTHKDASDLELSMQWAFARGYDHLVIYGCLGGRLDFTYAVTQNIVQYAAKGCRVFAVGADTVLTALVGGVDCDKSDESCICEDGKNTRNDSSADRAVGEVALMRASDDKGDMCSEISFSAGAEGLVSVFAASETAEGVTEAGLEYLLDDVVLSNTEPLGVSNSFIGRDSRIAVKYGNLLVFFPVEAWSHLVL